VAALSQAARLAAWPKAKLPPFLRQGRPIALILLVLILGIRTADPAMVQMMRMRSFDLLQELFPRTITDQPVAIVDVDDESLARIGQWPWPRTILAELVDRLTDLGAVVIGFDVVFPEPDRMSPARAAESFVGLDPATREALARLPGNDAVFAAALGRSRVVLGESALERDLGAGIGPPLRSPMATMGSDPRAHLERFPGIVRALPELEAAAAGRAMITIKPESDGIVRRVPLVIAIGEALFPALSFEMLHVATGESVLVRATPSGLQDVLIGAAAIPTDRHGQVWVHFARHEKGIYVSAKDVLAGTVDPARIANKFVLVGTSAIGLIDNKTTPLDASLPGVEVHAQLLETVLGGSYITRPDWADGAELFLIALTGLAMIVLVPISGARWTLLVVVLSAAAIAAGAAYLYATHAFLLDATFPLVTAAVLYTILVYASYSREESQRRQIRSAFGQYLSPARVEQLVNDPSKLNLGGEHRNMTFLFSDIRGFTAISERYRDDPADLTELINRYMTPMTDTILAHQGTIDKYIGDAIMAIWNAPLADPQHPRNACFAALAMLEELAALNERLAAEATSGEAAQRDAAAHGDTLLAHRVFTPRLNIGIGINTGDCIVGNMGSELRKSYTVLGDAVNLASRLESQSKNYGVAIVIGEDTAAHVRDLACIELDLIAVKGRAEAVRIYTLLGGADVAASAGFLALQSRHAAMIAAYRAQRWDEALAQIACCRPAEPRLAAVYALYEERIAEFVAEPPPPGWHGIYVAETK
jgi:adenylate cyclase